MIRIVASDPTQEELEAVLSNPDASYEVVDGEIVEKPQLGAFSRWIALRLYESLREAARAGGAGVAVHELMLILDAARPLKRQPDVAYVAYERWPVDREIPEEGEWEVVPELAIEILSPRDLNRNTARKVSEYFRYGVKQVWIILPEMREVHIYESPKRITVLDEEDSLDGGAILPGFRMPVIELFRRTIA